MNSQRSSHNQIAKRMACAALSLLLCLQFPALASGAARATASAPASQTAIKTRSQAEYGKLPLSFEANRGQFGEQVNFVSRQRGFSLALTPEEAVIGTVKMRMIGANAQARISGLEPLPGKTHYFLGNDPKQWRTDVPTYARVKYEAVYPGVDLIFYGNGRQLEYDFIVAPGADPGAIRLRFAGARSLQLDANGDLILKTKDGELRQHKPVVYQEAHGGRREVDVRYVVNGNQVAFALGAYDTTMPLVIDPVLSYSSYLGGDGGDIAEAIAVDAAGNAYLTGGTGVGRSPASNFPTTPGASVVVHDDPVHSEGSYIFVTKFNRDGSGLIYSAIIGGTRGLPTPRELSPSTPPGNYSQGIAVDGAGNAYVTGYTATSNFPTTPGALQTQHVDTQMQNEAFVFKLNATGSALGYSTLLGRGPTSGNAIAVDGQGQAWVTGGTTSRLFPTTAIALQQTPQNAGSTAFVSKLNAAGSSLLYSSFLSSGSGETGVSVALDPAGNAYVSGTTGSSCRCAGCTPVEPFPTTEGAFLRDMGTGCPATGSYNYVFAVKFTSAGALVYSTLLGVSSGGRVAADAQGNAYVTGLTFKRYDFPVTPGAFQTEIIGPVNMPAAFVAKLNPQGSALVYSTFLNGAVGNYANSTHVAVDAAGSAHVTGALSAFTFARTTTAPPFDAIRGVFALKLNRQGSAQDYAVILGEGESRGIATDGGGDVYLTGYTSSTVFPTTAGAYQRQRRGLAASATDAFVVKLGDSLTQSATHVSAANYAGATLAADAIIAAFGSRLATATEAALTNPLPLALAGTVVKVRDSAGAERDAPLFFVSPAQVNYLMPTGTASGVATITISAGDGTISTANVQIDPVAPGLFTADASGRGLAAAVALRVKANGEQSYEPIARYDVGLSRMMPMPVDLSIESEQVFLILYGTGLRHHSGMNNVGVKIGGVDAQALYAGAQGDFFGLDQVNVRLPRALVGRGEADIVLSVDGKAANTVKVWIK